MIYQFIEAFWVENMMSDYYEEYDYLPPIRTEPVTTYELLGRMININNKAETFFFGIQEFTSYATVNRDDKNLYDKRIRDVIYSFMYGNLSIQEAVVELQMHIDVLLQEQELSDFEIINT